MENPHHDTSSPQPDAPSEESRRQEARFLADFALLVTTLSNRFINVHSDAIDAEIDMALEMIGAFAAVDRSYVFQFSTDGARVTNPHEWCEDGIAPTKRRSQDVPAEDLSWALDRIKQGEVLYIDNLSELPPEADDWKRKLEIRGTRSVLNVPMSCAGKVLGFVGFDAVQARKAWRPENVKLLKVVGDLIASTIERERATDALTHRVHLETLVADTSTRFINLASSDLDGEIDKAIEEIGRFTGVDRTYVFQLSEDKATMDNTHEWCAPDVAPHIEDLQGIRSSDLAYAMAILEKGEILHVPDIEALPQEAASEQEQLRRQGIRTLIHVPIMHRSSMIGFFGFASVGTPKTWSEDDFRLLKLVGEIFANALERKRTEEKLQASLREKEVLLREIHHRVKNNLQIIHSLLYLQEDALRDQASPTALEAFQLSQNRIKAMAAIHDRLYHSKDLAHINFEAYLQALLPKLIGSYGVADRVQVKIEAHGAQLGIDQAIPCGLIVNELVTNSLKHAFPNVRKGCIEVSLRDVGNSWIELKVRDDGAGFPQGRNRSLHDELGMQLVNDLVDQLDGEMFLEKTPSTCFTIQFEKAGP